MEEEDQALFEGRESEEVRAFQQAREKEAKVEWMTNFKKFQEGKGDPAAIRVTNFQKVDGRDTFQQSQHIPDG